MGSRGIGVSLEEPPQAVTTRINTTETPRLDRMSARLPEIDARTKTGGDVLRNPGHRYTGGLKLPAMMLSRTLLRSLPLLSLIPLAAAAGACSSEDDAEEPTGDGDGDLSFCSPADTCPPDVTNVDLTTPVMFRTDVYEPFLRTSCGELPGCHGAPTASAANLYLGKQAVGLTDAEITALVAQLTTANSEIAPAEKNVVPGNWQDSFLMAKLDGCQSSYDFACNPENPHLTISFCGEACGDGMPANEELFVTGSDRQMVNKVRAWIAQGALDN